MRYLACLFAALFLILAGGCAATATAPVGHHATPSTLIGVAHSLDVIIVLAVIAVGIGAASFFFAPEDHAISLPLTITAAGVEASALVTRTTLWFIPYLAIALAVAAVGFFVYETYKKNLLGKIEQGAANADAAIKKL